MYWVKIPTWFQSVFHGMTWTKKDENKVYLTFDDGPIPEATPEILDILKTYDVKATFFCVGENVQKNHTIYQRILEEGHSVGNHTQNHLNGWKVDSGHYISNIKEANDFISSNLFRPPYGRINLKSYTRLKKDYQIIMWDVLSGDFDPNLSEKQCLDNIFKNTQQGSIIVMHDSIKTIDKVRNILPAVIEELKSRNFELAALPYN